MMTQQASFSGVDSMNVSTEGRFTLPSVMLKEHELLSMAKRQDICHLAARNVHEGTMTEELASHLREEAQKRYPVGSVDKYCIGATYVNMPDSMVLQMNPSNSTISAIVKRRNLATNATEEVNVAIQRSWPPLINFLQTEDPSGYGTAMKAVKCYEGRKNTATMMHDRRIRIRFRDRSFS